MFLGFSLCIHNLNSSNVTLIFVVGFSQLPITNSISPPDLLVAFISTVLSKVAQYVLNLRLLSHSFVYDQASVKSNSEQILEKPFVVTCI